MEEYYAPTPHPSSYGVLPLVTTSSPVTINFLSSATKLKKLIQSKLYFLPVNTLISLPNTKVLEDDDIDKFKTLNTTQMVENEDNTESGEANSDDVNTTKNLTTSKNLMPKPMTFQKSN